MQPDSAAEFSSGYSIEVDFGVAVAGLACRLSALLRAMPAAAATDRSSPPPPASRLPPAAAGPVQTTITTTNQSALATEAVQLATIGLGLCGGGTCRRSRSRTINVVVQATCRAGDLASAAITKFGPTGQPVAGTITIDAAAAGAGWFVDPSPLDSTAFPASQAAAGEYDLFTVLLHEEGHLLGFTEADPSFASHVITSAGGQNLFAGQGFTVALTSEKDHVDPAAYPNDLMNPLLEPGTRKLPSPVDIEILQTVEKTPAGSAVLPLLGPAAIGPDMADPPPDPPGLVNGNFSISDPTNPGFGWTIQNAGSVNSGVADLSEQSNAVTSFAQTFTIPSGTKKLQFTLNGLNLQSNGTGIPPDAFEVALLDATTMNSLVGTATGLTSTDALLNVQPGGTVFFAPTVTVPGRQHFRRDRVAVAARDHHRRCERGAEQYDGDPGL